MKTSELITEIASEIESMFNEDTTATSNPDIPDKIRYLATQLSARDHHAAIKTRELARLADIFYSADIMRVQNNSFSTKEKP